MVKMSKTVNVSRTRKYLSRLSKFISNLESQFEETRNRCLHTPPPTVNPERIQRAEEAEPEENVADSIERS